MSKEFNITGVCIPELHYMVNIEKRLEEIKALVDKEKYFVINRGRQYGKTTTLMALNEYLAKDYEIISLDFQIHMSNAAFQSEENFSKAFARAILNSFRNKREQINENMQKVLEHLKTAVVEQKGNTDLIELFQNLSELCGASQKPIVLMIDEVDSATNNQVFLDFLAQLRGYYLKRKQISTFQSVILAGVYDIKNLKQKIRPDEEHRYNSPWNIAANFDVDMSFSAQDIAGMLAEYEKDYHTGMDIKHMSEMIYEYTSGYPYLVSRLCKIMDEDLTKEQYLGKKEAWTKSGFLEAVRMLLVEKNTLFESLANKLADYPELSHMLFSLLFAGEKIAYNIYNHAIDIGVMFGFLKNRENSVVIANRIFETWLYNLYLSTEEMKRNETYKAALVDKNQFVTGGHLNMKLVLEKFVEHFNELYSEKDEKFLEEYGRRQFLLYLRPIINGTGNYYIEARTRDMRRTDVIVDYRGEQYIIEMKIWRGNEYNRRGEQQLVDYLEEYQKEKGYMVSFNFNKSKKIGVTEHVIGDKMIVEAVV